MGMNKIYRNLHVPGLVVSGVTSTADLDVRSAVAQDALVVTNQLSAGLLTVDSTTLIGGTFGVTGASSFSGAVNIYNALTVASNATINTAVITSQVSAGLLTVDSTVALGATLTVAGISSFGGNVVVQGGNLFGNTGFRGITTITTAAATITISATAIASGYPAILFAQSSFGQLIVSSIVDGVSFMAEAVEGTPATNLNLSYLIIR